MDDDAELWQALKERAKKKFDDDRKNFMTRALSDDDGGWTKHTQWHWSRTVDGQRLDYWPSRKKFQYKGTIHRGLRLMHTILKGEMK
jgi:hypothetical protein